MLGITDGDRGLYNDTGFLGAACGGGEHRSDDLLDGGTVKKILLRIVIGRRRDDDEIGARIGGSAVESCGKVQLAAARFRVGQEELDVFVADGGDERIDLVDFFGHDVDDRDVVMLRKQHRKRQPDVARAGDRDLRARGGPGLLFPFRDEEIRGLETERLREALELADARHVAAGLEL